MTWRGRVLGLVFGLALARGAAPLLADDAQAGPVHLEGKARADLLALVGQRMSAVRSFVAEFEQEKSLAVFKDAIRSSGFIAFAQPSEMRWEIRQPFRSILIVSDGKAAKFEWVDGARRTLTLGRGGEIVALVMTRIEGWFRGDFEHQTDYDIEVFEKPAPVLVLRPRDEAMSKNLKAIELALAPDLASIVRVTILDQGGDRTVMRYTLLARDVALPPATFSITEPADLDLEQFRPKPPGAPEKR